MALGDWFKSGDNLPATSLNINPEFNSMRASEYPLEQRASASAIPFTQGEQAYTAPPNTELGLSLSGNRAPATGTRLPAGSILSGQQSPSPSIAPQRTTQVPMSTGEGEEETPKMAENLDALAKFAKKLGSTLAEPEVQYAVASIGRSLSKPEEFGHQLGAATQLSLKGEAYNRYVQDLLADKEPSTGGILSPEEQRQAYSEVVARRMQPYREAEAETGIEAQEVGAEAQRVQTEAAREQLPYTSRIIEAAIDKDLSTAERQRAMGEYYEAKKQIDRLAATGNRAEAEEQQLRIAESIFREFLGAPSQDVVDAIDDKAEAQLYVMKHGEPMTPETEEMWNDAIDVLAEKYPELYGAFRDVDTSKFGGDTGEGESAVDHLDLFKKETEESTGE